MKILLLGYGKMGKAIETIARERGHEIAGKIDLGDTPPFPAADVAIEFTQPGSVVRNIYQCLEQKIPVVVGTTGWGDQKDDVEKKCNELNGTVFHTSNFSLGVNIFFRVNQYLAKLMEAYPDYNVSIDETHHTQKKDAPSGTAITLAEGVLKNLSRKKDWSLNTEKNAGSIAVQSFRIDPAPGTHVVKYTSPIDDIEIIHTAHNREGFARGALLVAEWLPGKRGMLTMDDFLKF